jgi:hypothetical protein
LSYGIDYGIIAVMEKYMRPETRKITAHLPADLLAAAQAYTGAGVTETLREALQRLAEDKRKEEVYKGLASMYGTLKEPFYDYKAMREDRKLW